MCVCLPVSLILHNPTAPFCYLIINFTQPYQTPTCPKMFLLVTFPHSCWWQSLGCPPQRRACSFSSQPVSADPQRFAPLVRPAVNVCMPAFNVWLPLVFVISVSFNQILYWIGCFPLPCTLAVPAGWVVSRIYLCTIVFYYKVTIFFLPKLFSQLWKFFLRFLSVALELVL